MKPFPDDFLWGTSQSGHPIEGGNFESDWWRWEQRPGRIADGSNSKEASSHWKKYEQDLDLAKELGHNAFLFSLEWSRIQPEYKRFDEDALDHYHRVFEAIHRRNLEPICVMQHVTLPRWFARQFGWHHKRAPELFRTYAERIAQIFAPSCKWWIPIREPMHWITMAYSMRTRPPASRNIGRARWAIIHIARAHAHAYRALHEARPDCLVGPAIHARHFAPLDPHSPWDVRTARREANRCNRIYLNALATGRWPLGLRHDNAIKDTFDFIGLAYYGRETIRFSSTSPLGNFAQLTGPQGERLRGLEYTPHAPGLKALLHEISRYKRPILITANGLATANDAQRCRYLADHAAQLRESLEEGIDLRGYCVRSLLDGFEWEAGYSKRYGLVHVDRATQARTPNPSALLYKELCTTGSISPGSISRYGVESATTKAETL